MSFEIRTHGAGFVELKWGGPPPTQLTLPLSIATAAANDVPGKRIEAVLDSGATMCAVSEQLATELALAQIGTVVLNSIFSSDTEDDEKEVPLVACSIKIDHVGIFEVRAAVTGAADFLIGMPVLNNVNSRYTWHRTEWRLRIARSRLTPRMKVRKK
jgi:hypothetical protein